MQTLDSVSNAVPKWQPVGIHVPGVVHALHLWAHPVIVVIHSLNTGSYFLAT